MPEEDVVAELVEGVDYMRVFNELDVVFSEDFWVREEARYGEGIGVSDEDLPEA